MALNTIPSRAIDDSAVTTAKIADDTIVNADINASAGITFSKISGLTGTQPTITSFTPTSIDDDAGGSITITGTNFESIPLVEIINTSTGAITTASAVTYTSSTSLTATLPSGGASGIYKVRVQNPTGLAAQSSSTLTYSSDPTFSTSAGSLGTVNQGEAFSTTVSASSDSNITYSISSGSLPTGLSLSQSSNTATISGTEAGSDTGDTTYNFTITVTDAESQTASRSFSITVGVSITEGAAFN